MTLNWNEIGVVPKLAEALAAEGMAEPTPVQREAVAALLAGADVTARSQTGSGKTLAFLLPALQRIDSASSAVQAVVLAPTQELAMQITRVAQTFGAAVGIRTVPLIGGAAVSRQIDNLKKQKPQLIVGTPGRIHELAVSRKLKLSEVQLVVIDEADQVFSLGSTREVDTLLKGMPRDRQVAFFSATRPAEMADMERKWMKEPKLIDLAGSQRVADTIEHLYIVVDKRDKVDAARRLIRLLNPSSALLFLNDTDNIAQWESKLRYEGFSVDMLYGDANKQRRSATLDRFRSGSCKLLIATDVAARGIDIAALPLVLNLDPPVDADHYVHRAGRTGRMGKSGLVITIITHQERFIMDKFSKRLGIKLEERVMVRGQLLPPEEARRYGGASHDSRSGSGSGRSKNAGERDSRSEARTAGVVRTSAERAERTERTERTGLTGRTADSRSSAGGRARSEERPFDRRPAGPAGRSDGRPRPRVEQNAANAGQPDRSRTAENRPDRGSERAKPAKSASPAMTEKQRKREQKDKGAPKWLKEKRSSNKTE